MKTLVDEFTEAKSHGLGSDNLGETLKAASAGRVGVLLLESEHIIPGRIVSDTGNYELADMDDPGVADLLDELGELVDTMGGQVLVMPTEHMPGKTGLAAIFRY